MFKQYINFESINYIFLDLDDTLCDLRAAESKAFKYIDIALKNREIDSEEFRKLFSIINSKLMSCFFNSEISKANYRARRFSDVLKQMGNYTEDFANELNITFMNECKNANLFEDVVPFLKYVKNRFSIALLTNGASDEQRNKILNTSLDEYIKKYI